MAKCFFDQWKINKVKGEEIAQVEKSSISKTLRFVLN
jgi:hypothetical protein